MDKFQNKYRTKSCRLQHWDYGSNAAYFVTICTANRRCYFGGVLAGNMQLSKLGKIAESCWLEIPIHYPFVILDVFVVMPNHVHGIIIIDKLGNPTVETQDFASPDRETKMQNLETQNLASLQPNNRFAPQSRNLASIVRGYKIGVTKQAKLIQADFAWQTRFHEHIIRSEDTYLKIAEYVQTNPIKWQEDKYHIDSAEFA